MSKERTSVTLDCEVAQYLKQDHVNASGLINSLVEEYMGGGSSEDVIREFRIRQVESELTEIHNRAEQKQKELDELQSIDETRQFAKEQNLDEAREVLADAPRDPTNPAIKKWAADLGITPQELIEELDADNEGDGE